MYKIGIVGCDNSHAITFGRMFNDPSHKFHVDGFKVTHVYDLDKALAKKVAEKVGIENIVNSLDEMINEIDIVFIEFRDGKLHLEYARPFIEAEIPVFVDKPLAASSSDAEELVNLAKKKKIPFTSFSVLRFSNDVLAFKDTEIIRLGVNGPGDPDSVYSGLIFYGIHVAEIINVLTGISLKKIFSVRKGKTVSALIWNKDAPIVDLRISNEYPYTFSLEVFTRDKVEYRKISDIDECYYKGLLKIKEMLDTGRWPIRDEDLVFPVKLINAIEKSYRTGSIVEI